MQTKKRKDEKCHRFWLYDLNPITMRKNEKKRDKISKSPWHNI